MALSPLSPGGTNASFFRNVFREAGADDLFARNFTPGMITAGGQLMTAGVPMTGVATGGHMSPSHRVIPVDVSETAGAYQLKNKADLPCVKKEDVTLDVEGKIIRIGARCTENGGESMHPDSEAGVGLLHTPPSNHKRYHRSERREYSEYQQRALRMPNNTDFSKMCASYGNGVLTIDVKKQPEQAPGLKKIRIQ